MPFYYCTSKFAISKFTQLWIGDLENVKHASSDIFFIAKILTYAQQAFLVVMLFLGKKSVVVGE